MKQFHFYFLFFSALLLPALTASAQMNDGSVDESHAWRFQVYLDDKPIGWHEFSVEQDGPLTKVETEASFDVKFFFITAYTYRHRNVELYDNTGLVSIDAYTDANGNEFVVRGERQDVHFRLLEGGEEDKLPLDLKAFCYWSPSILEESRLLNSQTGEYEAVEIVDRGEMDIAFQDEAIPARQYDIMVKGLPISIWYAREDGRWLALESLTDSGRKLRYEPEVLPGRSLANLNHLAFLN